MSKKSRKSGNILAPKNVASVHKTRGNSKILTHLDQQDENNPNYNRKQRRAIKAAKRNK